MQSESMMNSMPRRVALVTGGCGFIGMATIKALAAKGHQVIGTRDDSPLAADESLVRPPAIAGRKRRRHIKATAAKAIRNQTIDPT